MSMQKIVPYLWFGTQAQEAASFYVEAFGDGSRINAVTTVQDTPGGDCRTVSFELRGFSFNAINAGPVFTLNPSISFILNFDPSQDPQARENLDALWDRLSPDGIIRMPLDSYPFSKRYGWIEDKYGVSWQLFMPDPKGDHRPFIIPSLLFTGSVCGRAKEARDFYLSVFAHTKAGQLIPYGKNQEPDKEGTTMFTDFMLENQWFTATDSAYDHTFAFNEALSFMVNCNNQEEIDHYWKALSADPQAEQCGWLKDKFGISWQVAPKILDEMLSKGSDAQRYRVTQAFLSMKKFDIATLQRAYNE